MSNLISKLTAGALLVGASSMALAAPGNGIRLGGSEGRLHPFIELEARYDSNAFAAVVPVAGVAIEGESVTSIHVRPGFKLAVPGEMTSVELSARLDWIKTLGSGDVAKKLDNTLYADAELGIGVNKNGVVALELHDTFRRSDRPQTLTFGGNVTSNYNLLDLRVPFRPGGGALTLNLNGGWALETFELRDSTNCGTASLDPTCDVSRYGYNEVTAGAGVAWKFLPRTSALLDASYFKRLPNDTAALGVLEPAGYRVSAGVTGLVTPHIAATVKAGYGSTMSVTPTLGTWLAVVEGEWLPTETATVKLGYAHDLAVDPTAQYTTNRVALTARQLLAGRFALGLTGSWSLLGYAAPLSGTTTILQVSPSLGVEVTRWLSAEVAYAYTDRSSEAGAPVSVFDYAKSEAWLKVVATY